MSKHNLLEQVLKPDTSRHKPNATKYIPSIGMKELIRNWLQSVEEQTPRLAPRRL